MALVLVTRRRNFPKGEPIPPRRALKIMVEAFWALLTVFIIIGGLSGSSRRPNPRPSPASTPSS